MNTSTLLGYLAQYNSFSSQGEVLCTQGLGYLLKNPIARDAFSQKLLQLTNVCLSTDLEWLTEMPQDDGGRPDLEARARGKKIAKIEAKLGANLTPEQLNSYADDFEPDQEVALIVLVPKKRIEEVTRIIEKAFKVAGVNLRWHIPNTHIVVAATVWEEVFDCLGSISAWPSGGDVDQLHGLYTSLTQFDIVPLVNIESLEDWGTHERNYNKFIDGVAQLLKEGAALPPVGEDQVATEDPLGDQFKYRRRYFSDALYIDGKPTNERPFYSLGIRPPFIGHVTPFWLRFHLLTPYFQVIKNRLLASSLKTEGRVVESEGHIWVALVLKDKSTEEGIGDLVEQIAKIRRVAYERQR